MKNNIGIYAGSFDPITFGHLDIIKRSLNIVDCLIVSVANNINKKYLFSTSERKKMIHKELLKFGKSSSKKITINTFNGLLINFAKKNKATCIVRGLRAVSDFEYEFQLTGMNNHLNPKIETIFLMSSEKYSFISSSLVKEVHKLGGNVDKFVSKFIIKELNKKNF